MLWLRRTLTQLDENHLQYARTGQPRPVGRARVRVVFAIAAMLCILDLPVLWSWAMMHYAEYKRGDPAWFYEDVKAGMLFAYSSLAAMPITLVGIFMVPRRTRLESSRASTPHVLRARRFFLLNLAAIVVLWIVNSVIS